MYGRVITWGTVETADEAFEGGWEAVVFQSAEKLLVEYIVKSLVKSYVKAYEAGQVWYFARSWEI